MTRRIFVSDMEDRNQFVKNGQLKNLFISA